jgi:hypothetical protein
VGTERGCAGERGVGRLLRHFVATLMLERAADIRRSAISKR